MPSLFKNQSRNRNPSQSFPRMCVYVQKELEGKRRERNNSFSHCRTEPPSDDGEAKKERRNKALDKNVLDDQDSSEETDSSRISGAHLNLALR